MLIATYQYVCRHVHVDILRKDGSHWVPPIIAHGTQVETKAGVRNVLLLYEILGCCRIGCGLSLHPIASVRSMAASLNPSARAGRVTESTGFSRPAQVFLPVSSSRWSVGVMARSKHSLALLTFITFGMIIGPLSSSPPSRSRAYALLTFTGTH